jgi:tellurite resistance protein TehA-like permease
MRGRAAALRALDAVPPGGGATVMGTGIVAIGLDLGRHFVLSRVLLAVDVVLWLTLLATFLPRALRQRERWRREARLPELLSLVAACGVLGSRITLLGQEWAGDLLLALALGLWLSLVPRVVRHWRRPTVGTSFLLVVSTESLAVLAALLAVHAHAGWLAAAALAPLIGGLVAYAYALWRVDLGQLLRGRGDHWIFGGALAIATLACAEVDIALRVTGTLAGAGLPLDDATLALWAAAVLWLPALLVGEVVSPRLRYDARRWSTVFPVGMYAVATVATGHAEDISGFVHAGHIWVWPAFTVWTIVFGGLLARSAEVLRAAGSRNGSGPAGERVGHAEVDPADEDVASCLRHRGEHAAE